MGRVGKKVRVRNRLGVKVGRGLGLAMSICVGWVGRKVKGEKWAWVKVSRGLGLIVWVCVGVGQVVIRFGGWDGGKRVGLIVCPKSHKDPKVKLKIK